MGNSMLYYKDRTKTVYSTVNSFIITSFSMLALGVPAGICTSELLRKQMNKENTLPKTILYLIFINSGRCAQIQW